MAVVPWCFAAGRVSLRNSHPHGLALSILPGYASPAVHGPAVSQMCELSSNVDLEELSIEFSFSLMIFFYFFKILTISQLNLGRGHAKS